MELTSLLQPILQNQVVTGLSYTAVLGMVGYQLREIPSHIKYLLNRNFIVKVYLNSNDEAFTWIEQWLSKQDYSSRATSVNLKSYSENSRYSEDTASNWELSPGFGIHWFWWDGRFIWIDHDVKDQTLNGATKVLETIKIYTFGRSQDTLRKLIAQAHKSVKSEMLVPIRLWRGYWSALRGRTPRSLDTIVLEKDIKQDLIDDINRFLETKEWYQKRGIPWRRGYLISGPPGTGKTSFVFALAGHFNRPICVLNLGSVDNDDDLFSAMIDAPLNAIILIEDIDCAKQSGARQNKFKLAQNKTYNVSTDTFELSPDSSDNDDEKGITKAGLLNALDGITVPDGRILIMTTNHPDQLDPALIRPGRADTHFIFNYFSEKEQLELANLYYPLGLFTPLPYPVSPARLQSVFVQFPNDPVKAREMVQQQEGNNVEQLSYHSRPEEQASPVGQLQQANDSDARLRASSE